MAIRFTRKIWTAAAATAAVVITLGALVAGHAHEYSAGNINIVHPWARPTLGNVKVGAVYVQIINEGDKPETLLSVESDVAERVEIHETVQVGDVAKMQPVKGGIKVPADDSVLLEPLGKHIMLMGLKKKLAEGDTFPLKLVFSNQGEVSIDVKVENPAGSEKETGHDHHGHHDM